MFVLRLRCAAVKMLGVSEAAQTETESALLGLGRMNLCRLDKVCKKMRKMCRVEDENGLLCESNSTEVSQ